jgi:hypothetical protein
MNCAAYNNLQVQHYASATELNIEMNNIIQSSSTSMEIFLAAFIFELEQLRPRMIAQNDAKTVGYAIQYFFLCFTQI